MAIAGAAETPCGASTEVRAGDTLSSISERCNVSESRLLSGNPSIDGSSDLRVGSQIKIGKADSSVSDRIDSGADRVVNSLSNFAGWVGSSTEDLLEKNPDIKRRIDGLKDKVKGGPAATDATIKVEREPGPEGNTVMVSADGLPTSSAAVIGAGPPGQAYNVLAQVRTTAEGAISTRVRIPDSVSAQQSLIFVVADVNGRWIVRSSRFDMLAQRQ